MLPNTAFILIIVAVLLAVPVVVRGDQRCLGVCSATTPKCCTTLSAEMCCPANTECDFNLGCTLPSSPPVPSSRGSTDAARTTKKKRDGGGASEGVDEEEEGARSPLHEAVTVVFVQFTSVLRLFLMGTLIVGGACVFGFVHTTVVIRLHAWYRQRRQQQEEVVRGESSDEEPVFSDAPPPSFRSERRAHDGDDELQPLTAVSRESSPPQSPPPGLVSYDDPAASSRCECVTAPSESDAAVVEMSSAPAAVSGRSTSGDGDGTCLECGTPINCVLLRCNHAVVCYNCAKRLRDCPKCGLKIHRRQRLFIV